MGIYSTSIYGGPWNFSHFYALFPHFRGARRLYASINPEGYVRCKPLVSLCRITAVRIATRCEEIASH